MIKKYLLIYQYMCVYKIVSCKNLKHIKYQTIYKCYSLSRAQLFATPWTAAYQAPPSMRFSRQGYWSGVPFPSPGDLPNPGIEPGSPHCRQTLHPLSHQGSAYIPNTWSTSKSCPINTFNIL